MDGSRRRLPHVYPKDRWLFVTWHLHGSLPSARYPPPGKVSAGKAFVWMDRYLDTTRLGPMYLRQPEVARLMVEAPWEGKAAERYDLRAYVVMGNHVHVVLLPAEDPSRILKWLKGSTAREANKMLGRTGRPFWQRESYDHWVRNPRELERVAAYIENNPVQAGLARQASDYQWSSAWRGRTNLKFVPTR